jgi:hypothetical protein
MSPLMKWTSLESLSSFATASFLCQTLYRDDGAELGNIMRFYNDEPTLRMTSWS